MMEAHLVAPATEGCVVNRHIVKVHALHFRVLHSVYLHPPWTTSRQAPRQVDAGSERDAAWWTAVIRTIYGWTRSRLSRCHYDVMTVGAFQLRVCVARGVLRMRVSADFADGRYW